MLIALPCVSAPATGAGARSASDLARHFDAWCTGLHGVERPLSFALPPGARRYVADNRLSALSDVGVRAFRAVAIRASSLSLGDDRRRRQF